MKQKLIYVPDKCANPECDKPRKKSTWSIKTKYCSYDCGRAYNKKIREERKKHEKNKKKD